MKKMPVIFIGHGSPMNAIEDNAFTRALKALGQELPLPRSIVIISAHWETQGTKILHLATPRTIHDFGGFPQALFDIRYPATGNLEVSKKLLSLLPGAQLDESWGFDHGVWSVLIHLYPQAQIPITQISIDMNKSATEHLELGRQLQSLRDEGVLIVGTGNIVHNLRTLSWNRPQGALPWAESFDQNIKHDLETRNDVGLTEFYKLYGEEAQLAVPTPEHYYPLLYCYGASDSKDKISYPYEGFQMGSLSMRSVLFSA